FKYVEIAKFNKTEEELDTLYEKWLYVLKNLSRLDKRPAALKEKVFTKLFEEAEIAKFTPTELKEYEDSLKAYRDVKNSIDTALEKGREEGMAEGMAKGMEKGMAKGMEKEKLSTARRLLSMGLSEEQVSTATELPLEVIQKLREQA
uniref:PD-(D/E)XK nuclease family transposase n=1 Tax=Prevotella sp. AM42-24 TaxID=2293125 RepID=UPI000E8D8036